MAARPRQRSLQHPCDPSAIQAQGNGQGAYFAGAAEREIEKNVRTVVEGRADRFEFAPPHPTMARKFSAVLFCLLPVIVWLPHLLWSHCGVPPQPPCPVHVFDCNVTQHGKKLAPPRRFVGLFLERCGWLVGSVHKCDKYMEAYLERKTNGTLRKMDHYFFRTLFGRAACSGGRRTRSSSSRAS